MADRRALLLLPTISVALAGCPGPATTDDAAVPPMTDAFVPPMADAFVPTEDAFVPPMADAFVPMADAFVPMEDAFMEPDAAPDPLPPITDPLPHLAPASADGHDRFFGVTFAPDSSFYVVGVRAAGTDAATNDFETIVGHFTAAGDLDTSFGTGGWFVRNVAVGLGGEVARGIGLQSDGKIVVAVTAEHVGAADPRDRDVYVLRLNADGTLDTTFGTAGTTVLDLSDGEAVGTSFVADSVWNVQIDPMDRIVLPVGPKRMGATDTDFGVVRLTASGALDTTFAGGDGIYTRDIAMVNASVREAQLLPDGRIAAAGYYSEGGSVRPVIYLLDETGAPVTTFGTGGLFTELIPEGMAQVEAYAAAVQGGSFVTAGYGRALGPDDNDFMSIRVNGATGVRDLTYGGSDGIFILGGYDFGDNARALAVLPDERVLLVGALRTETMAADAALVLLSRDGEPVSTFGTGGVQLANLASGTVDHFWSVDVDPRGERIVVVGIGGTNPASDDDGLVYLLPVP